MGKITEDRKTELRNEVDEVLGCIELMMKSIYISHGYYFHANQESGDYWKESKFITKHIKEQLPELLQNAEEVSYD